MKAEKEKGDLMTRLHRVEGENINLRIEQDMMKQDIVDLNKEKSSLKVNEYLQRYNSMTYFLF